MIPIPMYSNGSLGHQDVVEVSSLNIYQILSAPRKTLDWTDSLRLTAFILGVVIKVQLLRTCWRSKDRAINRLIIIEQIVGFSFGFLLLKNMVIDRFYPAHETFGNFACYFLTFMAIFAVYFTSYIRSVAMLMPLRSNDHSLIF